MELADTSAWTNRGRGVATRADFEARLLRREIATCAPVKMELLWSARNAAAFDETVETMAALPQVQIDEHVWDRVISVWRDLIEQGLHRQVPQADLVVAAAAELAGVAICHYDRHFEVIAEVTGQPMRAIAPLGTL